MPQLAVNTNRRRASRLMLACLDDDGSAEVSAVLAECDADPNGIPGLISTLVQGNLELLVGIGGVDGARKTLELALLDAEVEGDDD